MKELLLIAIGSALVNNVVLSQFLGLVRTAVSRRPYLRRTSRI